MTRHKLLTAKEVSEWLGIPEATLKTYRSRPPRNQPPIPCLKLPNGQVRYREDQIQHWIEAQSDQPKIPTRRIG